MIALIVVGSIMVYIIGATATGRHVWGRYRKYCIDKYAKEYKPRNSGSSYDSYINKYDEPLYKWKHYGKIDVPFIAVPCAAAWPATLVFLLGLFPVSRLFGLAEMPKSDYEKELERKSQAEYIDKLERECKIGPYAENNKVLASVTLPTGRKKRRSLLDFFGSDYS